MSLAEKQTQLLEQRDALIARVAANPAEPTAGECAKAAILHLLSARQVRRLRHNIVKEIDPRHPSLANDWADPDMLDSKIVTRVMSPQIKSYLLDPTQKRGDVTSENPYLHPNLTEKVVRDALQSLKDEVLINRITVKHGARFTTADGRDDDKGTHYSITDNGIRLTPFRTDEAMQHSLKNLCGRIRRSMTEHAEHGRGGNDNGNDRNA